MKQLLYLLPFIKLAFVVCFEKPLAPGNVGVAQAETTASVFLAVGRAEPAYTISIIIGGK